LLRDAELERELAEKAAADARAAEEQEDVTLDDMRAAADARAAEEARADALASLVARTPLTEEEKAALREGGQVGEFARRKVVARATDKDLETKGPAGVAKVKKRKRNRGHADASRERAKDRAEALALEEARFMERAAGLLVDLGRGGSTVLDDDGAGAFPEDEEKIKALVAAKEREQDQKKKKNLRDKVRRARQALAAKALQRRVGLLEIRVAKLEEEMRAQAAA